MTTTSITSPGVCDDAERSGRGSAWRRRLGTANASANIETGNSVSIGPGKSEKANREAVSKLIKILGMLGTRHRRAALLSSVEAHRLEGST